MNLFFASFIPGLKDFTAGIVRERLPDARIHKLLDGAIIFETAVSYDKLNFFCFNNIFAVINIIEVSNAEKRGGFLIEKHVRSVLNSQGNINEEVISFNSKDIRSFRIVVSDENTPVSVDEKLRAETEKFISRLSHLNVNRSLPDTEFWFLRRREENGEQLTVFMKRLTLRSSWEKTLHKGELPPPLAWILCRLAFLVHSDTVLDPFCGYGSIPQAAVKYFHITKFIANDNNREAASCTAAKFGKRKKSELVLYKEDFKALVPILGEKSIDAIVTDPPWGHFKNVNDNRFLENMFDVFYKLLKDQGRAAVLFANDDSFLKAKPSSFELTESIPILLSGKKAAIYVVRKISN